MDKTRMNYFQEQEKAVKDTWEMVNFYIQQIPELSLKKLIGRYANERLSNKRKIRASLVKGTCIALGKDALWKQMTDFAAAIELWCIADYLTNDCFDNKLDQLPADMPRNINFYTIASAVTRELVQDPLINSIRKLRPEKEQEIVGSLSQIVREAYLHQWLDYGELRLLAGTKLTSQELEMKLSELFRKRYELYHTGNFFGQYTRMAATLVGATDQECSALESYGDNLSIGCQIVNDTADLLNKGYDLKNRLLTLPLSYTILQTRKNVYGLERGEVAELFINSEAFNRIKEETRKIMRKAKQSLRIFPTERRAYLSNLATLLRWNNQFRFCEEHKK